MPLDTGKRLHRYSSNVLPMGNEVINRVNALDRSEGQPMVASNFALTWDKYDEDINYESESDDEDDDDAVFSFDIPPQPKLHVVDKIYDEHSDEGDEEYEEAGAYGEGKSLQHMEKC